MPISSDDYLTKEVDYLRHLLADLSAQIATSERYALLATGAVWSWAAANLRAPEARAIVWVPLLLTQLFGFRAWGFGRTLRLIRKYLRRVEETVALPDGLGWQKFLSRDPSRSVQWLTGFGFWVLLSLATLGAALAYGLALHPK